MQLCGNCLRWISAFFCDDELPQQACQTLTKSPQIQRLTPSQMTMLCETHQKGCRRGWLIREPQRHRQERPHYLKTCVWDLHIDNLMCCLFEDAFAVVRKWGNRSSTAEQQTLILWCSSKPIDPAQAYTPQQTRIVKAMFYTRLTFNRIYTDTSATQSGR